MGKTFLEEIKFKIEPIIKNGDQMFAAFDADGTLWPCDVGRDFFSYQIKKGLLREKTQDPRADFDRICKEQGRDSALLWLAQIQSGFSMDQMEKWVQGFLRQSPVKIFLFQKELINWLMDRNVQVFIVSSSLKWILDKALQKYDFPKENIIGVETKVEKNIITDKVVFPAPINKDKVLAFQKRSKGMSPVFVSGNTLSDQALLELATHARLVVATAQPGEVNYLSERKLLSIAQSCDWFYQEGMPKNL